MEPHVQFAIVLTVLFALVAIWRLIVNWQCRKHGHRWTCDDEGTYWHCRRCWCSWKAD